MLKVTDNQIELTRGDTARLTLAVTRDGDDYDAQNDTVVLTVKTDVFAKTPLFQCTAVGDVITITPDDTRDLRYGTSAKLAGTLTIAGHMPVYRGRLEVTPLANVDTVLACTGLQMPGDVIVREIPYYETSNDAGGKTVTIG